MNLARIQFPASPNTYLHSKNGSTPSIIAYPSNLLLRTQSPLKHPQHDKFYNFLQRAETVKIILILIDPELTAHIQAALSFFLCLYFRVSFSSWEGCLDLSNVWAKGPAEICCVYTQIMLFGLTTGLHPAWHWRNQRNTMDPHRSCSGGPKPSASPSSPSSSSSSQHGFHESVFPCKITFTVIHIFCKPTFVINVRTIN